ncbi:hypothetical protein CSOJ01_04047 [Colletotrichum sojae]|uniref:Uncharacterized protein n=1 Tax=Colletotrichum sojae TaxID=2175907 RepID=A0A8H6JKX6_9PEZI|nr:hypothetical protein CSOJ01_04047 [Colletotrichum sojae]
MAALQMTISRSYRSIAPHPQVPPRPSNLPTLGSTLGAGPKAPPADPLGHPGLVPASHRYAKRAHRATSPSARYLVSALRDERGRGGLGDSSCPSPTFLLLARSRKPEQSEAARLTSHGGGAEGTHASAPKVRPT